MCLLFLATQEFKSIQAGPTQIARLAIGSSWKPGVQVLLLVQVVAVVALWIMRYLDQSLASSVRFPGKRLFPIRHKL
jgi:hypothetical protein